MKRRERVIGWRRDHDGWLVRRLRKGEVDLFKEPGLGPLGNCMGFVLNGKVFCREPINARAFDRKHKR